MKCATFFLQTLGAPMRTNRNFLQRRARNLRTYVAMAAMAGTCGLAGISPVAASDTHVSAFDFYGPTMIGLRGVRSHIQHTVDLIQFQNRMMGGGFSRPIPFAPEFNELEANIFGIDPSVLGYAKSPQKMVYKAQPQPVSATRYNVWGQLFGDHESRSGTFNGVDIGRETSTVGGIAGVDAIITGFPSASQALVLGFFHGGLASWVRNNDGTTARVTGPTLGVYAALVSGGFSVDGTVKADFLSLNTTAVGAPGVELGMGNYVGSLNVNYKFEFNPAWIEPTAGVTFTRSIWDDASRAQGFQDGTQVRLQAGARIGTSYDWGGVRVEPTLALLVYDDVIVNGGSVAAAAGAAAVPTDEGQLFAQAIGKLNFVLSNNLSAYVEGEVRGREGVFGVGGRGAVRYSF